jgi:glycosyltransferase involved in cell wall biosynthesis
MAAVGYVVMGFPRVSETFIASEIHRVEQAGISLRLFVVKPVEERETELKHPVVERIEAQPEYLPDTTALTAPLHQWRPRHLKPFGPALRRTLRRRPAGVASAFATAFRQALRDRRTATSGPRKIYLKELLQAVALADRLLDAPEVRHLHAHFAHGTTTVTMLASRIAGVPFSFTGHARDIYARELNPKGWLNRKLRAARFAVTCTEANVRHLSAIEPRARVHLVYHGLNADFARLLEIQPANPDSNGTLRVIGVGRLVAKKGFDTLVDACGVLQRQGVPFEAAIIGQDDKHSDEIRRRIERQGLDGMVRLPGPVGQAELLGEYRRASALCMPCRLLPNDRDGIPNVLVEAMAAGAPVIATGVSGIPELVEDERNGLLVEPDDPEALAAALMRVHEDRALATRLSEAARATVRERFDGTRHAQQLARLFEEALAG